MGVCAAVLVAGFLLKAQCLQPYDGRQYSRLCYNDLQPLYGIRGVQQKTFPYVHGRLEGDQGLVGGAIEYPVLTGVFMWFSGLFVSDGNAYLVVSAVLLAPFALLAAYLLGRVTPGRAWMWAAAPAVVLYAFHNWDLLVVAAAVGGFYAWYRRKPILAAVLFGIGGALKVFPIFFLAPLVLERWRARDRGGAIKVAAAGAGTTVAINLPFALINWDGWWATYEFHRLRGPNYDSIWTWLPPWLPDFVGLQIDLVSSVATLGFFVIALSVGWIRSRKEGVYPFLPVCAAMLAAFLLWNKVHSPQYTLWLLPLLALVQVGIGWWVAYSVVDLLVYVGVFRFFYDSVYLQKVDSLPRELMVAGVWMRAGLLLALFVVFLWARSHPEVDAGDRAPKLSDPPDSVITESAGRSPATV